MRQPKRKFYQQVRGQLRKYHYLTAVNSLEELDQFRLEVSEMAN
jgi:outer membrane protein assembly factor BamD (BamD/ComL family)